MLPLLMLLSLLAIAVAVTIAVAIAVADDCWAPCTHFTCAVNKAAMVIIFAYLLLVVVVVAVAVSFLCEMVKLVLITFRLSLPGLG